MTTLSAETIAEFTLCDASLLAVHWLKDGRDMQLSLSLSDGREAALICTWARDVRIDLTHGARSGGRPLSTEARFEKVRSSWRLVFEFPPQGVVAMTCNEAHLEYRAGKP